MKQWCLEEAALQGSGIWREQCCKTWYLEEMAPLEQQCLEGRQQRGEAIPEGSSSTEHGTWRTWHHGGPVPVGSSAMGEWCFPGTALWGNGTCREQRCGRVVPSVTTPWGTVPVGNSTVGERYL